MLDGSEPFSSLPICIFLLNSFTRLMSTDHHHQSSKRQQKPKRWNSFRLRSRIGPLVVLNKTLRGVQLKRYLPIFRKRPDVLLTRTPILFSSPKMNRLLQLSRRQFSSCSRLLQSSKPIFSPLRNVSIFDGKFASELEG